MSKIAQIMTKEAVEKLCISIEKRGKVLDNDIQKAAVTSIGYANIHGDVTIANRLLGVIPSGARKSSLVRYFEIHGHMAWDKEVKAVVYHENDEAITDPAQLVISLADLPWYEAKSDNIETVLDLDKKVQALIKSIASAAKSGKQIKGHGPLIEMLCGVAGVELVAAE